MMLWVSFGVGFHGVLIVVEMQPFRTNPPPIQTRGDPHGGVRTTIDKQRFAHPQVGPPIFRVLEQGGAAHLCAPLVSYGAPAFGIRGDEASTDHNPYLPFKL